MNILVVDDQPINRKLLRAQLEAEGHTVLEAAHGVEALQVLEREPVGAVISDILMPNMDGFRLCREIRQSKQFTALPFILYTNTYDSPSDRRLGQAVGADGYVIKPAPTPVILDALREAIRKAGERKPLQIPPQGEVQLLKQYSEVLVQKLEENSTELREALETLRHAHEEILQRERALRENEKRTNFALAAAGMGVWEVEFATNRLTWSDTTAPVFGLTPDKAPKATEEFFQLIHPDDRHGVEASVGRAIAGESAFAAEFRTIWPDGSTHWVYGRAEISYEADGKPLCLLGIGIDITARKSLEAQFEQAQKMEAIGQLAGGIAHDFNNLLTVINGTTDLALLELGDAEALRADLGEIRKAGERAAALTRQLLAFSRKQILQPRVLSLAAVVANTESMLRRLIGEDIDLVVRQAESLGAIKADAGQLEQVLVNLVVNARDAMPQGGTLTVETRNVELDQGDDASTEIAVAPGPYVMLAVSDTGVGMDEVTRRRLFEPFYTTKGPEKGTGLGLSTVYGIIAQSGGIISVRSEIGRGATFKIYLPRVTEAVGVEQPRPTVTATTGAETILLVDDNQGLRGLARRILVSAGYTVLAAGNGEEALLALERHEKPVHLLLTDVVMPGMKGHELAQRSREIRPGIKVLYASGYTDNEVVRHGVLDQEMSFVAKPFTAAELTRKVREVLDS